MSAEKKFLRKKKLFEKITGIFKVKLAIKRYPKQYIKRRINYLISILLLNCII